MTKGHVKCPADCGKNPDCKICGGKGRIKRPKNMKIKLITTASNPEHPGFLMLKKSLDKFGWDWEVCGTEYNAFGSKMVNAYHYAKQTDCTHLFIVDAYDVVALGTMKEALSKIHDKEVILFNGERNAWPYEQWAMLYPKAKSSFKYLNGGMAFVSVPLFIKMFEENPITHHDNDQVNLSATFLTKNRYNMQLDNACDVFQTLCSTNWGEFTFYDGRILNKETETMPVLFHANGRHPMDEIWKLI